MSFDEEPDDDPHGECAAEINRLYGALENCWLYAARHRKEEWAKPIMQFCKEAGLGSPLRHAAPVERNSNGRASMPKPGQDEQNGAAPPAEPPKCELFASCSAPAICGINGCQFKHRLPAEPHAIPKAP